MPGVSPLNDAVLGVHTNTLTSGVARFNELLAKRLGIPHHPITSGFSTPLVSIKPSECRHVFPGMFDQYDLFLHGPGATRALVMKARRVFVANAALRDAYATVRSDLISAWCPSLLSGNPGRGSYRVLTFGMAHKIALDRFRQLKRDLDEAGLDYTVAQSIAIHDGHTWEASVAQTVKSMTDIFGDRFRFLGALADDALAKELNECDAVAVYFDPAARENNTTYWSAIEAGKTIYTNRDECSPEPDVKRYSWDKLVSLVCG